MRKLFLSVCLFVCLSIWVQLCVGLLPVSTVIIPAFPRPYDIPLDAITDSKGRVKKKKHLDKKPEDAKPLTASRPSIYDDDITPYATAHSVTVSKGLKWFSTSAFDLLCSLLYSP